jgi:hypothetical protein
MVMAHIRTWAELNERKLTPAEEQLIEACQKGELCVLADGSLPPEGTLDPDRHIHADVLRYLILGGCKKCVVDDIGVWVEGAHVTGTLDLNFAIANGAIRLRNSRFDRRIDCEQTKCRQMVLDGNDLQGLRGQTLKVTGSVFLRGVTTHATIDLNSATIGGQLACTGATFKIEEGNALNAQGAKVTGSVFLRKITTHATIDLNNANITGHLDCGNATFEVEHGPALNAQSAKISGDVFLRKITSQATIELGGANISGLLDCEGATFEVEEGFALDAEGARIKESLFWRDVKIKTGAVDFTNAKIGTLIDDKNSWRGAHPSQSDSIIYHLDGMTYDRIGSAPTNAKARLKWLKNGTYWNGEFSPQPYTQLAKVLRDMGHDSDARSILLERDRLLVPQNLANLKMIPDGTWEVGFKSLWYDWTHPIRYVLDFIFRWVAGYGHRPFRSLVWLFAFWLTAAGLSHKTWETGDFAPASPVLLASPDWKSIANSDDPNPAKTWSTRKVREDGTKTYAAGQDWSTFSSFAYAADLVIPIINLGQTDTWGPSTERGKWGKRLWRYGFMLQIFGWIVTALGAAAITGLIRRD